MQELECEAVDIINVRRGENLEEIAYKAKVLKIDGEYIFSAIKLKVDKGKRKAGTTTCWKQTNIYSEPIKISSCHFDFLEVEYNRKKK